MPHPVHVDSPQTAQLLADLLRDKRGGKLAPFTEGVPEGERFQSRPPIAFVSLEELASGGSALALGMQKTDRPVQIVTLRGNRVTGGDFALHYGSPIDAEGPDASGAIAFDATAAEMRTALETIEAIGSGAVRVYLGETTYTDAAGDEQTVVLGRWIIEFLDRSTAELLLPYFVAGEIGLTGDPSEVVSETHFLVPTDKQVTIHAAVPVGTPSAMRPGAIGLAEWYHGIGYAVDALEARHFAVDDEEVSS